jgi:hypothetical protein
MWPNYPIGPDILFCSYTLHGLRKTYGTYLAECNASARMLIEMLGHTSMKVSDIYVERANKKKLAIQAAGLINQRGAHARCSGSSSASSTNTDTNTFLGFSGISVDRIACARGNLVNCIDCPLPCSFVKESKLQQSRCCWGRFMSVEFWKWLFGVVASSGVIGVAALLMRDTLAKFFSKSVEHRFEKKLETFKADIRDNEKELDQIRSFLVSARRERDSAIQAKRREAAEILLRARHGLSQFSMLVEYMKILNGEQILKDANDPKITEFIEALLKPFDVDEKIKQLGSIDKTVPKLYLSDRSLKIFDAYESIILQAVMMMKLYSIPLRDKGNLIKAGSLSKTVIELAPGSKEGFDEFGEGYAYYWVKYFHDEILRSLRHEVSGTDDLTQDTKSIERLALDSRQAQINIRTSLQKAGLPETLIKSDESAAAISSVAEKT